jgi:hypothetical protein
MQENVECQWVVSTDRLFGNRIKYMFSPKIKNLKVHLINLGSTKQFCSEISLILEKNTAFRLVTIFFVKIRFLIVRYKLWPIIN